MRGKQAPKRDILPDSKFNNFVVAKFINYVMRKGKKTIAQKVVYNSFEIITKKAKKDALEVFEEAIKNVGPTVETKSRRVGGANYQVPMPVRGERKNALAFKWIIEAARKVKGKPMAERLANELIAASENQGEAIKKKMDIHRMAEANKAFAHFAR
ncbi:MAG: 30S ribosomal protein S7 [Candidatus Magasanikbacteria bacterium GW2011_GWC2_40_17]|uniref:Small ribosomal subunit protein uS7 n=1 Tax=Candidatus Magasanikbacteria bacterium GW2011_GWA2_42_32 TaxID=1619039 RepID=A0A0G1A777_9BACT|nr:MAG: 30S ribosomal protein S7 [Candidatus Magasanikbacteria bacterium GW2011_GWC2_40_17]KKS56809.1 MAG: 30S ribosomal protein S7 [Candidatus Magasanikbacteria bacterium GW2011_GWA2_42_32]OGH86006.1 MAG: 30S ribosomal protein S7 [Candidatus Magasanikbacteria bacterium RIFOXYB2_FULL_38_10]